MQSPNPIQPTVHTRLPPEKAAMARQLLVDGRNFIVPAAAADAGLEYEGIGLGDEVPARVTG